MSESEAASTRVDRQTLYDELWEMPGTQLARKYGVSDVALGKACRRHDIPRPPPGYWTMKKHGYEVERTPLPAIADPALAQVQFHPQPDAEAGAAVAANNAEAPSGRPPIPVPDQLLSPHPLVAVARLQLRCGESDDARILRTNPGTALNIAVAASSVSRALKLMDALIRAWEQSGGSVQPGVKSFQGHHSTAFSIRPDKVLASLRERTETIPNWVPPKGASWRRRAPHRPTGRLEFCIEYFQGERLRSTWADGTRQRLEDILNRVLDGLLAQVEDQKRRRLDRECKGRQKAILDQRRTARNQNDEVEKQRRERLAHDVARWQEAGRIRAYLKAMHESIACGKSRVNDEKAFTQWSEWASWYADHLDPFVRALARHESARSPDNRRFEELDLTSGTRVTLSKLSIVDADALYKLTEKDIAGVEPQFHGRVWSEVCRVLDGLAYDISGRRYWV